MNQLPTLQRDLERAKAKVLALSNPYTQHLLEAYPDYWLNSTIDLAKEQCVILLERTTYITPGSPEDISSIADETNCKSYYMQITSILYQARKWRVELRDTYLQEFDSDELDLLRSIGKIQTQFSEYETLVC